MKIVVYAICKDEEQFVDRWMDSMSELKCTTHDKSESAFCYCSNRQVI